jgi:hypothetical protein
MGGSGRQRKKDSTEDVGGQLLLSFGLLKGLLPIGRSEFEQAVPGPAGDEAQQVAEVGERLDPVQPGCWRGERRRRCSRGRSRRSRRKASFDARVELGRSTWLLPGMGRVLLDDESCYIDMQYLALPGTVPTIRHIESGVSLDMECAISVRWAPKP